VLLSAKQTADMQCIVLPAISWKCRLSEEDGHVNPPTGTPHNNNTSIGWSNRRQLPMTILAPGAMVGAKSVNLHLPLDCDTSMY